LCVILADYQGGQPSALQKGGSPHWTKKKSHLGGNFSLLAELGSNRY
jgi:hypothetical protein